MLKTTPEKRKEKEEILHRLLYHERRALLIVFIAAGIITAGVFFSGRYQKTHPKNKLTLQETAAQRFIDDAPVAHGMSGTVTAVYSAKREFAFRVRFPFDTYAPVRIAVITPETTFSKTRFTRDAKTGRLRANREDIIFKDVAEGDDVIVSSLANVKEARRFNAEHVQVLIRPAELRP